MEDFLMGDSLAVIGGSVGFVEFRSHSRRYISLLDQCIRNRMRDRVDHNLRVVFRSSLGYSCFEGPNRSGAPSSGPLVSLAKPAYSSPPQLPRPSIP